MKHTLPILAIVAVFAGAVAMGQDEPPALSPSPPASDAPSEDMTDFCRNPPRRFYPQGALDRGIGGRAVLDCAIGADGAMTSCQIVEEEPRRMQFGRAALGIACRFRVQPVSDDFAASMNASALPAGSQVYCPDMSNTRERRARIPIVFRLGRT